MTRSRHQLSADTGLDNILENQEQRDFNYITKCLKDRPKLYGILASMLRDGEIDRALARREQKDIRSQLGRPIGARSKVMKHLAPRLWFSLFQALKQLGEDQSFEPDGAEPLNSRQVMSFCLLALNCTEDTPLPRSHAHPEFEGPLLAVLTARATRIGNRLADLVYANRDSFGWAIFDPELPTQVSIRTFASPPGAPQLIIVQLPFVVEFMRGLTVTIKNNCKLQDITLVDDGAGFCQSIWPLLQRQHPNHGLDQGATPFELPDAADAFASIAVPTKDDNLADGSAPGSASAFVSPTKPIAAGTNTPSSAGTPPPLPMVRPPTKRIRKTTT